MRRRNTALRSPLAIRVTDPVKRLPFAAITDEIERLRATEREWQAGSSRLDLLQRGLMSVHPGNLVILMGLPGESWAPLPEGWQTSRSLTLIPRQPPVPLAITGPVAISEALARAMVRG